MADINTVIEAANELFESIEGIKEVYLEAPDRAPLGGLPCVIPVGSTVAHRTHANSFQAKDYTIRFFLLVTPYNKNLVSMEKRARPFADLVLDTFFQHVKLGVTDNSIDKAFMSDAEYGQITYNDEQEFLGWIFTLTATIKTVLEQGF